MALKGSLVVISGFSGVGKGTVIRHMMETHEGYAYSVSATTREMREGEKDGVDYFFITEEEFTRMIRDHELIEYTNYCDHFYGTPKKFVRRMLEEGKDVILEIETQGANLIRRQFPDALLMFIMPPSGEELLNRLNGRGSETDRVIRQRMQRAAREAECIDDYDYVFINDKVEECAEQIHSLIISQKARTDRNFEKISKIRREIGEYLKGE